MNDLQRYLVDEFVEDYQERRLTRRDTLKLIASIAGSLVVAEGFLAGCAPFPETEMPPAATASSTASAAAKSTVTQTATSPATVSPSDSAVEAGAVEFPSGAEPITGYLAQPKKDGKFPVVLVCHENRVSPRIFRT